MPKKKEDERMSRSEAGRKGGEVAHEKGTAHEWTSAEAREAGRKGGEARGSGRNEDEEKAR